MVAPFYDTIMENSVFPKKFGASYERHTAILRQALFSVHGMQVLDVATGTGAIADYLLADNALTCTDTSPYLLRIAKRKFAQYGINEAPCIVADAESLPFADSQFDAITCILALNFFKDPKRAVAQIQRVLKEQGICICSVPEQHRLAQTVHIAGTLFTEESLVRLFGDSMMEIIPIQEKNGGLFYFIAKQCSASL